jgi:signal transduction histidine kinase
MNFVANAAITAAIINVLLAAFVLYTNPRSALNRVYAMWGGSVGEAQATVLVGIIQGAVIFLPLTLAHLCQLIVHGRTPRWIYWFYGLHVALLLSLIFTPYYMQGVQRVSVLGWWSVAGPLFKVYLASYIFLTLPLLIRLPYHAFRARPIRRAQLLVLWFSILTLWMTGTNDMLPIVGKTTYPGTSINFIPLGNFGAIFYGLAVAYSVLHHQLLDIYYAFSRLTSLLLRVAFVVGISLLMLLGASAGMPGTFDAAEMRVALIAFAISTLIATFLFPKLLGGSIERIERALVGDRFELPDKVRAFIEQMKWQHDLTAVLDELSKFLAGTFRLRGFSIALLGETRRGFSVVRSLPPRSPQPLPNLQNDGSIFSRGFESAGHYIVLEEVPSDGQSDPQAKLRSEIHGLEGRVVFPFRVDDQPLGFLLVGDKQNGSRITLEEAKLLAEIAQNISVIVNQISLKNQIVRAQELELIGRMSQGMAHDLNNLTTPISTLLQLLESGSITDMMRDELLPVSNRNMKKMCAYIQESLFFTKNLRLDLKPLRLDQLVETVIADAMAGKRKDKPMRYEKQLSGEVLATLDAVLIQRLLSNLIANAIDASEDDSVIRVTLHSPRFENHREWVRIEVMDQGTGISHEDQTRIFEPYFSTKKTGDAERGFGLGLAICRKIAAMHGGTLAITSEPGKGTTVALDIPCHLAEDQNTLITTEPSQFKIA